MRLDYKVTLISLHHTNTCYKYSSLCNQPIVPLLFPSPFYYHDNICFSSTNDRRSTIIQHLDISKRFYRVTTRRPNDSRSTKDSLLDTSGDEEETFSVRITRRGDFSLTVLRQSVETEAGKEASYKGISGSVCVNNFIIGDLLDGKGVNDRTCGCPHQDWI